MKSGRGGKRPGAGRKRINQDENMIRVSGRLSKDQWEALQKVGGFSAIRRIINFCFITGNDLRQFIYFDDGR
jgi:hypothetical protein